MKVCVIASNLDQIEKLCGMICFFFYDMALPRYFAGGLGE